MKIQRGIKGTLGDMSGKKVEKKHERGSLEGVRSIRDCDFR